MESQFSLGENERVAFTAFYFSLGWHNRQKPHNNNSGDDDDDNNDNDDEDDDEQNEPKQKKERYFHKKLYYLKDSQVFSMLLQNTHVWVVKFLTVVFILLVVF